jgi:hypothetical protein
MIAPLFPQETVDDSRFHHTGSAPSAEVSALTRKNGENGEGQGEESLNLTFLLKSRQKVK